MPNAKGSSGKSSRNRSRRPRRGGRRARLSGPTISTVTRTSAIPDRMRVVLPYMDYYTLSLDGSTSYSIIQLNSTYAPVGATYTRNAQPTGRDQWVNFYKNYIVRRAKFRSTIMSTTETSLLPFGALVTTAGVLPNPFSGNDPVSVQQESRIRFPVVNTSQGSPESSISSKGWLNLWDLVGRTEEEYMANVDVYGAAYNATPTQVAIMELAHAEYSNLHALGVVTTTVEFEVEFFNRINIGLSALHHTTMKAIVAPSHKLQNSVETSDPQTLSDTPSWVCSEEVKE